MDFASIDLNLLAKQVGTHERFVKIWAEKLHITILDLDFMFSKFTKRQLFNIVTDKIKPKEYLVEHQGLLNSTPHRMGIEYIKSLPEDVYQAHLKQMLDANKLCNELNSGNNPGLLDGYYDAEVFCAYRHYSLKKDIDFIKKMFTRKIGHHTYRTARQTLTNMCLPYMPK